MTATAEAPPESACATCGSPLAPDQDWCLECGIARRIVHRPPDWRIPAAIIGTVALLVLAGFAIALAVASSDANRDVTNVTVTNPPTTAPAANTTAANTPTTSATAAPATHTTHTSTTQTSTAATTTTTSTAPVIPHWPTGQTGWTVELFFGPTAPPILARAQRLIHEGFRVGVLSSSRHPAMTPGRWIVFEGHFPTQIGALAEAARFQAQGFTAAAPVLVAPPSGP